MQRSTHIYVSWNGATDLVRWHLFAQAAHDAESILVGFITCSSSTVPRMQTIIIFTIDRPHVCDAQITLAADLIGILPMAHL